MDLKSLNAQQFEAVTHGDGPLMVLAGAGSGKTRVIVHRIAHLIRELGVKPDRILAVTFTNKAAREMKERITSLLDDTSAARIAIGTFHSVCARILRREHRSLKLTSNFTIVTESEQHARVKRAVDTLNIPPDRMAPRQIVTRISNAKNRFQEPEKMLESAGFDLMQKWTARVYEIYQAQLEQDHALDFDDLIVKTVRLLEDNPLVRDAYQERYRYILVDEYQDTNHAQYRLISILSRRYRNVMVVGDDDQSIYRWRGAEISNILNFERDFPGARTVKLEQNYRSTQAILTTAAAMMENNRRRTGKKLVAVRSGGEKVMQVTLGSDREEAEFLAKELTGLHAREHREWSDFGILFRTNAQSRLIEESCLVAQIPFRVIGNTGFFNRKEVKDLFAYIRLALNPLDSASCLRILNTPRRGIGAATREMLMEKTGDRPMFRVLESLVEDRVFPGHKIGRIADFVRGVLEMEKITRTTDVPAFVRLMIERFGYREQFETEDTPESTASLEIIEEFVSAAEEFHRRTGDTLDKFCDYLALNQEQSSDRPGDVEEDQNTVSLLTLHNAKGLEFPVVFITGLEEGLCPCYRSLSDLTEDDLEEERRIVYVGMTRAMQKLFLLSAQRRFRAGKQTDSKPSRFLMELPEKTLERINLQGARTRRARPVSFRDSDAPAVKMSHPFSGNDFRRGDRVVHKRWGTGTVIDLKGRGPEAKITVSFDRAGRKKLLLGPSRLFKMT
ncbi:UvrD-helicase domain-containing protein [bacterium]|nr:UvrD-helicase domain-containing protein [candidate division CSSED10-310 bacterium]